jgi:predicted esterase
MTLELGSFLTTDGLKLPSLLYAPDKPTQRAAVWLHGMGDNGIFYRPERINALGEALTKRGIGNQRRWTQSHAQIQRHVSF